MNTSDLMLVPTGSAGWAALLHPSARLLCGLCAFIAALAAPVSTLAGKCFVTALPLLGFLMTRTSLRKAAQLVGTALLFYVPFFLLTVAAQSFGTSAVWGDESFAVAWKGGTTVLLAGTTLWSLSLPDLHAALRGIRVPSWIALLTVHILHQTESLIEETHRIVHAIAVRAGGSRMRVLRPLPLVWLPRILFKADRVAMAMEVRGYDHPVPSGDYVWHLRDAAAVAASLGLIAVAVFLRTGGRS